MVAVGHVRLEREATWDEIAAVCANLDSPLRCVDPETEAGMMKEVDNAALRNGDTVGPESSRWSPTACPSASGEATAQWDSKLDGQLARAMMSVQAVKAVEIGSVRCRGHFVWQPGAGRDSV